MKKKQINRCDWTGTDKLMIKYHDEEWGVPVHDDRKLFEFFTLDAFQAGLSWKIILHKRENFRKAFDNFDVNKIAGYDERKIIELLNNKGIIRNRLKIEATINNAKAFIAVRDEFKTFDGYIWQFTDYQTIQNKWGRWSDAPTYTDISDMMSEDLKKRGFKFVGSTICYAFMQAAGLVNDHQTDCFRYRELLNRK
jgi:DNA-3-methyladenine glycosylase I